LKRPAPAAAKGPSGVGRRGYNIAGNRGVLAQFPRDRGRSSSSLHPDVFDIDRASDLEARQKRRRRVLPPERSSPGGVLVVGGPRRILPPGWQAPDAQGLAKRDSPTQPRGEGRAEKGD